MALMVTLIGRRLLWGTLRVVSLGLITGGYCMGISGLLLAGFGVPGAVNLIVGGLGMSLVLQVGWGWWPFWE